MNPHIPAVDADVLDRLVESLVHAEGSRRPIEPLTATVPTLSMADAYAIQTRIAARRVDGGERVVGRKVGLTSTAMQAQLGVAEPDFGVLFESMVIPSGARLAMDTLIAPRVEAEFAVRMGRDLSGPRVTLAQARDAVAEVMLALEIIDSRIVDWRIGLADTIADNASSARVVLGSPAAAIPELLLGLPHAQLVYAEDGEVVDGGPGSAVLGDPIEAVVWLARRLSVFGVALNVGDVVMTGGVHASRPIQAGTELSAWSDGFSAVSLLAV
ncbi:MAG: fumarylacetoacetate hydrolase family protein [Actinomycetota bacterium]|nr:fumarylacetoacetate hydrolase family protein [Actinomycetota bacterium]